MDALMNVEINKFRKRGTYSRVYSASSVNAGTYRTDLSVTGVGYLLYVASYVNNATNVSAAQFRITVDGGTPYIVSGGQRAISDDQNNIRGGTLVVLGIRFRTSLLVETYNSAASALTVNSEVSYVLST